MASATHNRPGCVPEGGLAALAEFLRIFRIREDACKRRQKRWVTVFFSTQSFIVSSILVLLVSSKMVCKGKIWIRL